MTARDTIDKIDRQLVKLFAQRLQAAEVALREKQTAGTPIHDPAREQEVLENVKKHARELGVDTRVTEELFQQIIAYMREHQNKLNTS
ncbi:MAG: chorismate mutase [Candidatus Woesearchaeota archaeon]|nr:chorismate mutase [Candidatus Woesearchaeota archaeon]